MYRVGALSDMKESTENNTQALTEKAEEAEASFQVIVFELGGQEYGLFIDQIREVVPVPRITEVPLTANYIKGVANVRGNILAIIDLEERFQLKKAALPKHLKSFLMVLADEEMQMGILVNDIPNTLTILEKNIDLSPNLTRDSFLKRDYIKGIAKVEERIIILIDALKIIDTSDFKNL